MSKNWRTKAILSVAVCVLIVPTVSHAADFGAPTPNKPGQNVAFQGSASTDTVRRPHVEQSSDIQRNSADKGDSIAPRSYARTPRGPEVKLDQHYFLRSSDAGRSRRGLAFDVRRRAS